MSHAFRKANQLADNLARLADNLVVHLALNLSKYFYSLIMADMIKVHSHL